MTVPLPSSCRVEIRLVKRRVSEQDQQQMPFLNFSTTVRARYSLILQALKHVQDHTRLKLKLLE